MPKDATNMPQSRSAIYRKDDNEAYTDKNRDSFLKIENMLLEEFNYASLTAYQAMEDRARMFNLYLLLFGVIVSGLGVIFQLSGKSIIYSRPSAISLLIIAGLVGIAFFVKLIRLRQAWRESVICMNVIKEFYIQQCIQQIPQIGRAFRWRLKTIPAGERFGSTTFVVCSTVALLESACFGGAAFIATSNNNSFPPTSAYPYLAMLTAFTIPLASCMIYYWHSLNQHDEQAAIEEQAEEIGV